MKYVAPTVNAKSFTCPHCHVYARQHNWGYMNVVNAGAILSENPKYQHTIVRISRCDHCEQPALWFKDKLAYPDSSLAPSPNPHMPAEIKRDYEEAASILGKSPRGAAALLRLAIQKLCVHLECQGQNINQDIKSLVSRGLPTQVQQALDVVRVTGNNAVHPGQIDTNDTEIAGNLFPLVNVIVEYMIDMPQRISGLYDALPDGAKKAIEQRDKDV